MGQETRRHYAEVRGWGQTGEQRLYALRVKNVNLESLSICVVVWVVCLCLGMTAWAEQPPSRAVVELVEVHLDPSAPLADTLCTLEVTLENRGQHTASLFAFSVEVAGRSLEVYDDALFVAELPPGERRRLQLFNFRTAQDFKSGEQLVVRLEEARWVEVAMKDGEEEWVPRGPVEGLPSVLQVALDPKESL